MTVKIRRSPSGPIEAEETITVQSFTFTDLVAHAAQDESLPVTQAEVGDLAILNLATEETTDVIVCQPKRVVTAGLVPFRYANIGTQPSTAFTIDVHVILFKG